jgi:murein DD-endopeptidase MepM/ murein hydrolase activator NlpD
VRRLALLTLLLVAALLAGTARADTFAVVKSAPTFAVVPTTSVVSGASLMSALSPNVDGTVALPFDLSQPPASPVQLSYPQLLSIWQQAGAAYGIPWQVLASINKVESNFGRNMGPSSAGAIGWMQFMPSTWVRWGMDANGDGLADPWNPQDAIFSAARYLAAAGGQSDLNRGVYAYNHADWYVKEVLDLANVYGSSTGVVLSLDRLQMSLDAARKDVVDASTRLIAAQKVLRALNGDVARRSAIAERAPLLSDRLTLEAVAGRIAIRRDAQAARVAARQRVLASARQELDQAQQQSAASSFTPAASELFGAPSYSDGYVFPVGGGPGLVSAGHTHHDYPAVDIAAPMGSPLYALADSVVVRSWSTPDVRCGIGLTLQAFDGQVWTYCHLSVLDPNVVPGTQLKAGDPVGLVGATGDATGPHLHLQLQPATAWPQEEPWFQSFAGTAFTWSDTGANDGPAVQRTLAVVPVPAPVVRTLAMAADTEPAPDLSLGGGPVFAAVPAAVPAAAPQASAGGVVYFSRPRS